MQTRTRKNIISKTGQTYSDTTGDDGNLQAGWPKNGADSTPRFLDMGDNTIVDRAMNLVWIKRPELIIPAGLNANDAGVEKGDWINEGAYTAGDIATDSGDSSAWICLISHTAALTGSFSDDRTANPSYWVQSVWATSNGSGGVNPVYRTQYDALADCAAMTKGSKVWKLPNVKELVGLVDYSTYSPAINTTFFPNCQSDYYWTSTAYAGYTGFAWVVRFSVGGVYSGYRYNSYYVRPCRQY